MSLTVRFPTGVSIRYNQANFIQFTNSGNCMNLLTKPLDEGGKWIATVSIQGGVIVEAQSPCAIENPVNGLTDKAALKHVANIIRSFNGYENGRILKHLKAELGDFNATKGEWKDG